METLWQSMIIIGFLTLCVIIALVVTLAGKSDSDSKDRKD